MRADGGQRGEQRRVVERPAPDRGQQRALPARAERAEDAVALAQQARGQLRQRLGVAAHAVAHALHDAPDQGQRAVGGHAPRRRGRRARRRRPRRRSSPRRSVALDRAADDAPGSPGPAARGRRRRSSRFAAVSAADGVRAVTPASTSIRYCSAPPTAPPPGAIFDSALPASCEVTTAATRPPAARGAAAPTGRRTAANWATAISREPARRRGRRRRRPSRRRRSRSARRGTATRPSARARCTCAAAAGRRRFCASPRSISPSTSVCSSMARSTRSPRSSRSVLQSAGTTGGGGSADSPLLGVCAGSTRRSLSITHE